jgi:hypothetical protein
MKVEALLERLTGRMIDLKEPLQQTNTLIIGREGKGADIVLGRGLSPVLSNTVSRVNAMLLYDPKKDGLSIANLSESGTILERESLGIVDVSGIMPLELGDKLYFGRDKYGPVVCTGYRNP